MRARLDLEDSCSIFGTAETRRSKCRHSRALRLKIRQRIGHACVVPSQFHTKTRASTVGSTNSAPVISLSSDDDCCMCVCVVLFMCVCYLHSECS